MIRSYLKIAIRNLVKRRDYSILNIVGLAIGISCCLLIFQYVSFEKSYDQFLPKADQLYRLRLDHYQNGRLNWQSAAVYPAFGPAMKKDFPEVEDYCRLSPAEELLLSTEDGNVKLKEKKGYYADPSFLSMFGVHVVSGNPKTALQGLDRIMLSSQMAKKYFGSSNALGKLLTFHSAYSTRPFEVSGVFDPLPVNSHLRINYLVSYKTAGVFGRIFGDTTESEETSWGWYDFYTYLQLKKGTDVKKLESEFPALCDRYINSQEESKANNIHSEVHLIPVRDIHLHSHYMQEAEVNGNAKTVSFLFLIAIFIIGIAWLNYINLTTARSLERAREVGVRKLIGAVRLSLVKQFFIESFIINLVSFLLALLITISLSSLFRGLINNDNQTGFHLSAHYWFLMIATFLMGSFLSGLYPAFILSGFKPVVVLKGLFKNSAAGLTLRKALIIVQFTISIVLLAGTFVVYRQIKYMRSQPLGVNIKETLVLNGPASLAYRSYESIFQPFKNSVTQLHGVESMTVSSSVMGKENSWANDVWRFDSRYPNPVTLHFLAVDHDFVPSYQMKLLAGRNFSREFPSDTTAVILNDAAIKVLGFESPEMAVGQKIIRGDTMTIIGVVQDYHAEALNKTIDPLLILLMPYIRTAYSIKIRTTDIPGVISSIEATWNKYFPSDPFDYYFLDESFNSQYKADIQFGRLFGFFASLAIIIACVGLLGLSAYNVLQRRKEIGIRKVLGARVTSVVSMLSKDFLKLVIIAIVVASPAAWIIMNEWLRAYAYRIHIGWWTLVLPGLLSVVIALIAVSFQTIKAAIANPVKSLRTE